jgi:hypothetical protein
MAARQKGLQDHVVFDGGEPGMSTPWLSPARRKDDGDDR